MKKELQFLLLFIPAGHDYGALPGKGLKGCLAPAAGSREALDGAEGVDGDFLFAGDEFAGFDVKVLGFANEDEVVDQGVGGGLLLSKRGSPRVPSASGDGVEAVVGVGCGSVMPRV